MQAQITIFLVLLFTIIWQNGNAQSSKISVELGVGVLNGDCFAPYPVFMVCFECQSTIEEQQAKVGLLVNFSGNIAVNQRHSIGIGCQISELNFEQTRLITDFLGGQNLLFESYLLKYRGWHISHCIRLLKGRIWTMSLRNGVLLEKLLSSKENGSVATHFRERNLGVLTKFEFQWSMNKLNELIFSPTTILALNNYDNHEYLNTNYRPFRYGFMLSWRTYLSR